MHHSQAFGVAVDLGDSSNLIANVNASGDSTKDVIDENPRLRPQRVGQYLGHVHLTRELHSDPVTQALLQWLRYPTPVNSQHRPSRIRRSAWAHQHYTRRPQARLDSRQRFFVRSPWTRAPA